jgi:hypothetical protein
MRTFFFAVLPGKIIKNWWLAGLAAIAVSIITSAA